MQILQTTPAIIEDTTAPFVACPREPPPEEFLQDVVDRENEAVSFYDKRKVCCSISDAVVM